MMKKGMQYVLCLCLSVLLIFGENKTEVKLLPVVMILSVFLFLWVSYLEKTIEKPMNKRNDTWYMWIELVLLLVAYGVLVILAANAEVMMYTDIYVTIVLASGCLCGSVGWLIWLEQKAQKVSKMRERFKDLDTEACYEKIKEHRQQISFLRHDMLNRIRNIPYPYASDRLEEAENLVKQIELELQKTTKFHYCEHPMIDITLTKRIQQLQEKNIFPNIEIRLAELGEFDYIHVNMLIHILFNHVEACIGGDNQIQLKLYNNRKFHGKNRIYIYINMSTEQKRLRIFQTKYLREAQKLVRRIGGSLDYEHENHTFIIGGILEVEE